MRIGRILTEAGAISGEQLERALDACPPGTRIGEYLVREGLAEESQVLDALAAQIGMPRLDEPSDEHLDGDLVRELPVEWARRERLLPIRWRGGLGALCADPASVDAFHRLARTRIVPGSVIAPGKCRQAFTNLFWRGAT
jgi:hypothetical protein